MGKKYFDDIIEAIRYFEPNSPLLNIKDKKFGRLKRNLSFNLMKMPNGKMSALPKNFSITFYRGEDNEYDFCKPNIYRGNPTKDEKLINRLKIIDFSIIINKHPRVEYAEKDGMDIHYDATAFFATNSYNKETNCYKPTKNKIGCLRRYRAPEILTGELSDIKIIGLQPFKRPGVQCAFGIDLKNNEDFSNMSNKILFKQKKKYSRIINNLFCNKGFNKLIPPEDDINDIAKRVKSSNDVSKKAISIYCEQNSVDNREIINRLEKRDYRIVNDDLFRLSRQRRKAIKREIKDKPYGDVKIYTRLCYSK